MNASEVAAVVAALLSGEPDPDAFFHIKAGGADIRYEVVVDPCPRPLPAFEVEGKTVICGRTKVPRDHELPQGKTLDLAFAVLRARTLSPAPDPLVYLHGGPGAGALDDLAGEILPLFSGFREHRDVVLFDQRAAGRSAEVVTCSRNAAERMADFVDPTITGRGIGLEFLADCLAEIRENGVDLTLFNTTQSARDVRAIVSTLGYSDYNIYGISYGTQLALEIMRTAPVGLRSVVLDSVLPPHVPGYQRNVEPLAEATQAVLDLCAGDGACRAAYPDLEALLHRVAGKLAADPIPSARGRPPITIDTLLDLFEGRNDRSYWPEATAHIPIILTEWDLGITDTWDMLSAGGTVPRTFSDGALGAHRDQITPEQAALARAALGMAEIGERDRAALADVLQDLEMSLDRVAAGRSDLVHLLDRQITGNLALRSQPEAAMRLLSAYAGLATADPSKGTLRRFAETHLTARSRIRALEIVDLMTPREVRGFYGDLRSKVDGLVHPVLRTLDHALVACQEHVPFNSREGMAAFNAGLRFDFLRRSSLASDRLFDLCDLVPPAPRAGYHAPVRSDIPTLVLVGLNDTQTAPSWGVDAAGYLSGARLIRFPDVGHGVIGFSDCARDIGVAFVSAPESEIATGCVSRHMPQFVLP
ncbi:alpha/beta hydrolase [Rhodovulum sp. YNF3179]|uniref:alpha/beta hydrolase n=1 Tax=Rhodovulum sp. YNF3179 TaxID=3425127 RepID=UPI003D3419D0